MASAEQVKQAARAVAKLMYGQQCYAVVGGAACLLLGSPRFSSDVDIVVPKGETKAARALLKPSDEFETDGRMAQTVYRSDPPVDIQILTPPILFREKFNASTPTLSVQGVDILKPALLLNAKCKALLGRYSQERKDADAHDIKFLLKWCVANEALPVPGEVPNASARFIRYFVATYSDADLWADAGFDLQQGKEPHASLCSIGL